MYYLDGAPVAGTDEIQTLTFGAGITGGTFKLAYAGNTTAAITWSATNNTLVANIDAALALLPTVGGAANVTTAVATMTAGIGTITVTFVATLGKQAVDLMTVANNSLTGVTHTLEVEETTPGVTASSRGRRPGALLMDYTNGNLYVNRGTAAAPTWTLIGPPA